MTNHTDQDAREAREWAEYITSVRDLHGDYAPQARAAARFILATTTPPTMADVEWDDEVHAGLCAEHTMYGIVRMLRANATGDIQILYVKEGRLHGRWTHPINLTPIPGTKIDLTPRREPKSTPEHPVFLETEEDYRSAPEGTIVAEDKGEPFVFLYDAWRRAGSGLTVDQEDMDRTRRRVLRWGREA